jgi:isopenicillin N synthase-like dioxygenase
MPHVPVIDIGALRSDDPAELRTLATCIGLAARETGFFTIVNHGIPAELIDRVFAQSHAFFELPFGGPDQNLWPEVKSFQNIMEAYYRSMLALVIDLHRPVAIDLGATEHFFEPAFRNAIAIQRLLYYPPQPGVFDGTLHGAAPHTDYGNLTLLAQDDAGGLELQMRDGTWIDIEPTPGAFVCNIGDCLMRWSNDVYVSNLHRVVNRSGRARYSVAFFGDPAADARVECLPSCTDAAHPPKYEPIDYATYLRKRLTAAYPLKSSV